MTNPEIIKRMDKVVDEFVARCAFFHEPLTEARARNFVMQHWKNTRHRNSVLKLRVATNCPVWDIRLRIIQACSEELIADVEHGQGKAHWMILEELGMHIGMSREEIRNAPMDPGQEMCWAAWDGLMSNRHWLEGLVANTCAERINLPGYGNGDFRKYGWFGIEHRRWKKLFGLSEDQLEFFKLHTEADIAHSNLGWHTVAEYASDLSMNDAVVEACRRNLVVWEHYLNGIAKAADQASSAEQRASTLPGSS